MTNSKFNFGMISKQNWVASIFKPGYHFLWGVDRNLESRI